MQARDAQRNSNVENLGDAFWGTEMEEAPLLDTFEVVFPPVLLPTADVFEKEIQSEPVVTSALAGKRVSPALCTGGCSKKNFEPCFDCIRVAELRTTATGLKAGIGVMFFKRFARLLRMGFVSWHSKMVQCHLVCVLILLKGSW